MIRFFPRTGTALLTLLLAACGIEGTGSQQAGIEGTGYSEGSVSTFGSVYVNGVEFDISHASVITDNAPATESSLHVGMLVTVNGDVGSDGRHGSASQVEFHSVLRGPIETTGMRGRHLIILGQVVTVDDDTVLVNATRETLAANDFCVISGFHAPDGSIVATYLERLSAAYVPGATAVAVEGIVKGLAAGSFQIGALNVNDASAVIDTTEGRLENGALVAVSGVQDSAGAVLDAQSVAVRNASPATHGAPADVEGLVSQFKGLSDFVVNGQHVHAATAQRTDQTSLTPGNGLRIHVVGRTDARGVLQAEQYSLRPASVISYMGRADSVDATNDQLTLLGVPVNSMADTQFIDISAIRKHAFTMSDIAPGDYVRLSVFRDAMGNALAGRVERRDVQMEQSTLSSLTGIPGISLDPLEAATDTLAAATGIQALDSIELGNTPSSAVSGPVDSFDAAAGSLSIAGVAVQSSSLTTHFSDRNGNMVSSTEFFAGLQPGDVLVTRGTQSGGAIQASALGYAD